jgi:hypothetical protein
MSKMKTNHEPKPPANIANPWFGSDVAAIPPRASVKAAELQRPMIASKMSTTLLTVSAPIGRISSSKS